MLFVCYVFKFRYPDFHIMIFFFGTPVQFILGAPAKVYPFSSDYLRPHGKDADPWDRHHQAQYTKAGPSLIPGNTGRKVLP